MSNETIPVTVRILEKEYKISCPAGEHESLVESAKLVNDNMQTIRDAGKALGAERIAVMAAINIAHELFNANSAAISGETDISARLEKLQESVETVLVSHQ